MSIERSITGIKQKFVLGFLKSALTVIAPGKKNGRLCILNYHRVLETADPFRQGEVDIETFTWHMSLLKEYFNVLPLSEAVALNNKNSLPPRAICVTFDDGYADNEKNALPVLQQMGIPTTFFIATGYLVDGCMWNDVIIESVRQMKDQSLDLTNFNLHIYPTSTVNEKINTIQELIKQLKYMHHEQRQECADYIGSYAAGLPTNLMLNPSQIVKLYSAGMEIASHTVSHPILKNLSDQKAKIEISESKKVLEDIIKDKVSLFAYPNGVPGKDYGAEHVKMVKEAGFNAAVTTQWGVANYKSDPLQLPRFLPWNTNKERYMFNLLRNYFRVV